MKKKFILVWVLVLVLLVAALSPLFIGDVGPAPADEGVMIVAPGSELSMEALQTDLVLAADKTILEAAGPGSVVGIEGTVLPLTTRVLNTMARGMMLGAAIGLTLVLLGTILRDRTVIMTDYVYRLVRYPLKFPV